MCFVTTNSLKDNSDDIMFLKFNLKKNFLLLKKKYTKNKITFVKKLKKSNSFNPFASLTQEDVSKIMKEALSDCPRAIKI